jgi:hypothetical protein
MDGLLGSHLTQLANGIYGQQTPKLPLDTLIKPFSNPKAIQIVVAGGKIQAN